VLQRCVPLSVVVQSNDDRELINIKIKIFGITRCIVLGVVWVANRQKIFCAQPLRPSVGRFARDVRFDEGTTLGKIAGGHAGQGTSSNENALLTCTCFSVSTHMTALKLMGAWVILMMRRP
jgi:hypothetical protein